MRARERIAAVILAGVVAILLRDAMGAPGLRTAFGAFTVFTGWALIGSIAGMFAKGRGWIRWVRAPLYGFWAQVLVALVLGVGDPRILVDGQPLGVGAVFLSGGLAAMFSFAGALAARPPPSSTAPGSPAP